MSRFNVMPRDDSALDRTLGKTIDGVQRMESDGVSEVILTLSDGSSLELRGLIEIANQRPTACPTCRRPL